MEGLDDDSPPIGWRETASTTRPKPDDERPATSAPSRRNGGPIPVPPSFQAFRTALASQAPALDPGKPGLRVLLAVGALAIAVAAFFVWRSQPAPEPLPPPTPISPSPPSPTDKVTVHVAGKIRKPGVYLLPSGARVTDAVTAAGGVARGASTGSLNLARRLIDGEQIVVGATAGPAAPGSPVTDPAGAVIDLNSATAEQLEQLPGVGEVLAARIIEFRDSHGGFTSVDQLREVSGIGPPKLTNEVKLGHREALTRHPSAAHQRRQKRRSGRSRTTRRRWATAGRKDRLDDRPR
ncbi:ComEA family DNA-binding protein [Nonomuraea basaltis]|nr:ComEA family DNA-binding protein [Nonomuraea basaltis]